MKSIQQMLFFFIFMGLATTACQPSSDSSNPKPKKTEESEKVISDYSICEKLPIPQSLDGSWSIEKLANSNEGDSFHFKIIFKIEDNILKMNQATKLGALTCNTSVSSPVKLVDSQIQILSSDYDTHSVESADKKNRLDCSLSLNKANFNYHFEGGCLVISSAESNDKFVPVTNLENGSQNAETPTDQEQGTPLPLPTPTQNTPILPPPVITPPAKNNLVSPKSIDEVNREVCDSFSYNSDRISCFEKTIVLSYLEKASVDVCLSYSYPSDQLSCVLELNNIVLYDQRAIEVCTSYTYNSDKKSCLKSFNQRVLDNRFADACMDEVYVSDRQKCLLKHSNIKN